MTTASTPQRASATRGQKLAMLSLVVPYLALIGGQLRPVQATRDKPARFHQGDAGVAPRDRGTCRPRWSAPLIQG